LQHPSKIRSTVWQPKEVMSLEEIDVRRTLVSVSFCFNLLTCLD
jgi:hypothetical protein